MLEKPPVTIIDHANGGKGRIILEHIAGPETLRENARLFVKATLEKGCSMGVHKHKGDREIYHILSGKGEMQVGGETGEVRAGDTVYLDPDVPHTLRNTGDSDMEILFVYSPAGVVEHWREELEGKR